MQQPQFAQPQFAQMVIGGQVQQVQVLGGMPQQPQPAAQQIITLPNGQQAIVAGAAPAATAGIQAAAIQAGSLPLQQAQPAAAAAAMPITTTALPTLQSASSSAATAATTSGASTASNIQQQASGTSR